MHLFTEVRLRLFLASLHWVMKQHVLAPASLTSNLLTPGCHPCATPGYVSDKSLAGLLGSGVFQTMGEEQHVKKLHWCSSVLDMSLFVDFVF